MSDFNKDTKIEEYLFGYETYGIFTKIYYQYYPPYLDSSNCNILDSMIIDYYGDFEISPIAVRNSVIVGNKYRLDETTLTNLAHKLFLKYNVKWVQLNKVLNNGVSYNPLDNYDKTDTITRGVNTKFKTISTNKKQGFNSNEFKDDMQVINEGSDNDNVTSESVSQNARGNIGVTTSQKMIEEETQLRNKYQFYEELLKDIKQELVFKIYN